MIHEPFSTYYTSHFQCENMMEIIPDLQLKFFERWSVEPSSLEGGSRKYRLL